MGTVPGFCDVNHHSFLARKLLGTVPDEPGDSPEFTTILLKLAPLPQSPFVKGGALKTPLFGKEGLGEIRKLGLNGIFSVVLNSYLIFLILPLFQQFTCRGRPPCLPRAATGGRPYDYRSEGKIFAKTCEKNSAPSPCCWFGE
jgi:hypothetical protein